MSTYGKVIELLDSDDLTAQQLHSIARYAVDASRRIGRVDVSEIGVGSDVQFTNPKTGSTYKGRLIKINRTKAQVKVDGTVWNVPFSFLKVA
jgi:phosphotransacetylase